LTSIIIPTLNEEANIEHTLEAVFAMTGSYELIVVDGGSKDRTIELVKSYPDVHLYQVEKAERAAQMNFGAQMATGTYLLFLHADTKMCPTCLLQLEHQLAQVHIIGGSYNLQFDQSQWPYRLLAFFTRFNSRFWTFGDQGIFVKKHIFDQVGGYASIPILEDLDLQLRLRKQGAFIKISKTLTTSARRYRADTLLKELLRDASVLCGYFLGISPYRLRRWYDFVGRRYIT
jgi:rSAM/selenodomain-associated transferase 2